MRKFIHILIIIPFVACLSLTNCGGDGDGEHQLREADAVMNSAPDSALRILNSISTDRLNPEQQARLGLMLTKAADKNYLPIEDDSLISMAAEYFSGRGDSLETQSLFYHGFYYAEKRISDKALVLLNQAYENALAAHDDFYTAMSAREMSIVYRRLLMIEEALKWARIARQFFEKADKPYHAAWMNHNIADALFFTCRYEEAEELLDSVDNSEFVNNAYIRRNTILGRIKLAMHFHEYKKVLSLYDSLSPDNFVFTANERLTQAKAAILDGMYEEGDRYLSMARQLEMTEADSLFYGKLQSQLFAARNDYKNAYEVSWKFGEDLMRSDEKRMIYPQTQLLIDNLRLRTENHKLHERRNKAYIVCLVGFSLMLTILIIILWRNYRAKLDRKKMEIEHLSQSMQALHDDLTMNHDRYSQINDRYELLNMQNSALKLSIQDHETLLKKEVKHLFERHLKLLDEAGDLWYQKQAFHTDSHVHKKIRSILNQIGEFEVIEELEQIINRCDDNWMKKFRERYPDLKDEDYRLTIFLYLGFRPTSMVMVLKRGNISSIYTAKSRLKKKLLDRGANKTDPTFKRLFNQSLQSSDKIQIDQ